MNNIFKKIETEETAYILGFISADGCIAKNNNTLRIHLKNGSSELKLINKIHKILNLKTKISYPKNRTSILLTASNKEMKESLFLLGITPNKTFTVPFLNMSSTLMPHYIRGYFDGDGWISFSKQNNYSYITTGVVGNNLFCHMLNEYLQDTINFKFSTTQVNKILQLQSSGCYKCFNFLDYIYKDSNIHLDRKYILYKNLNNFIKCKKEEAEKISLLQCPYCFNKSLKKYGSKKLKTEVRKKYKCIACKKSTINPII